MDGSLKIKVKLSSDDEWIELEGKEAEELLNDSEYTDEQLDFFRKAREIYQRYKDKLGGDLPH